MIHIAKCIVDIDSDHIMKSPSSSPNNPKTSPLPKPEKQSIWKMRQPEPPRKYQLFPKVRRLPVLDSITKDVGGEKAVPSPQASRSDKTDKLLVFDGLKKRLNHHSLAQRHKIRVVETEPMTTVPELAMDSATIPGRLPSHEHSISVPSDSFGKHHLTNTFDIVPSNNEGPEPRSVCNETPQACPRKIAFVSPKNSASLVIPKCHAPVPLVQCQQPLNCFSTRDNSLRSSSSDRSPQSQIALTSNSFIPSFTTPYLAAANATTCATLPTPISAPPMESQTAPSKQWGENNTPSNIETEGGSGFRGYRKGDSEVSAIINTGRLRKGPDLRTHNYPILQWTEPKKGNSLDPKAFEQLLPSGLKQADALEQLEQSELSFLRKQAFAQIGRFEVLKAADVKMLSEELCYLDERNKYLRHIYSTLLKGRRNLHSRILQYLRSPHTAKFSHESIVKQEEALAELDASIDDWMNKLKQAENRRTRVHQKLLEHMAAAACLVVGGLTTSLEPPTNVIASGVGNISTASRSLLHQTFTSAHTASSSTLSQPVVRRVLSTVVEQAGIEEAAMQESKGLIMSTVPLKRDDVESIRIYAGDDVYAHLDDIKNKTTRMGNRANPIISTADMI
ncbi:hypothetical protein FOBRF1_013620 [Fusarium oxysporum]